MIAVDWGTSSFRAYRLDAAGQIRETRSAPAGILTVGEGGFAQTLERQLGDWLDDPPIVMSGMIGSRQGWLEVPYAACPCGIGEIASGLREVRWGAGRRAWIAPGLVCRDASGVPDVMRGEETQILGALSALPTGEVMICLPGTHSKWACVRDGMIVCFATAMTGEIFATLRQHSILGRLMPSVEDGDDTVDDGWFDAGLARAGEAGGLLHHLFGVRARGLFDEVPSAFQASYLSGILIGHELADLVPPDLTTIHLIGAARLVALYDRALRSRGSETTRHDPDCVARGLGLLSRYLPEGGYRS